MNSSFVQWINVALSGSIIRRYGKTGLAAFLTCLLLVVLWQCALPSPAYAAADDDLSLAWSSTERDYTTSVAWGDWDGDGDLDLAVGNYYGPSRVYENTDGLLSIAWSSIKWDNTRSVAWGDWDGDGDLDLAAGNSGQPNRVYENVYENGHRTLSLVWSSPITDSTTSVAWGDWDSDGDLDLAVGNSGQPNRVYRNNTAGNLAVTDTNRLSLAWSSSIPETTSSVAWGDWDADGDLDLAVGNGDINHSRKNRVYRNDTFENSVVTDANRLALAWSTPNGEEDKTQSVAWGDWDEDGDLDLATGNLLGHNRVYENTGGILSLAWTAPISESTNSAAWGDWDGDGDLDLAVGNGPLGRPEPNRVYRNDTIENGVVTDTIRLALDWTSNETDYTYSVAWGDSDGDGDIGLAAGNFGQPNRVYGNVKSNLLLAWPAPSNSEDHTTSVAWGDWDSDGALELAMGRGDEDYTTQPPENYARPNVVYENEGGTLSTAPAWTAPVTDTSKSVAWGDWDGDGDLDLAVGNSGQPNRVYEHISGTLSLVWSSPITDSTTSVAWGDWDGDGDLDLAAGNSGQPNRVYRNYTIEKSVVTDTNRLSLGWSSPITDATKSVAWGDWDVDGDLDLAVGNWALPNRVYENVGGNLLLVWSSDEMDYTNSVAWGDWDGDGDLDLAVGNGCLTDPYYICHPKRVYQNSGDSLSLAWSSAEMEETPSVAWGDWDEDGDLDLAAGTWGRTRLYANTGGRLSLAWSSPQSGSASSVAWGDWDSDGDLDLAAGNIWSYNRVYANHSQDILDSVDSPTRAQIEYPGGAAAPFFASAIVLEGPTLPITYSLFDAEGDPARFVRAWYSLDGGSHWQPALAVTGTETTNLTATVTGTVHTYSWDIYRSGVIGASNSVVFRLDVYQGFRGPGPYQHPFRTARTLPFRVRGSQVRVVDETGRPRAGAMVYHQDVGQTGPYEPYHDSSGEAFLTNPAGYLSGYGSLGISDTLVALLPMTYTLKAPLPISYTDSYSLYYTSAAPGPTGLDAQRVKALGVQTLTVTTTQVATRHPVVLFNLDVSLQWDARNDSLFLPSFEFYLQRASELLYDWTDGQAALGRMTIYHNREHWNDAHLRVYASNSRRPSAAQGGIVSDAISDTDVMTITYTAGQVHMGAAWNRYGEPAANLGEDWARTLAHELGHYAFFLDDNYLGFNTNHQLIPVDRCSGAMADPYRQDYPYDEFHPAANWLPECEQTLSNQITGRADWETVETYYPWLHRTLDEHGPSGLPLAVTRLSYVEPVTATTALEDPTFYLSEGGARVQPGSGARAFLYQDGWALDLGKPTLDHILARGARPGDEVCVYEPAAQRLGCETVSEIDNQLAMTTKPGWQPDIVVSPVDSVTLSIEVSNVPTDVSGMTAKLYPLTAPASGTLLLSRTGEGVYSGTFHLAEPDFEGYVRAWADEAEPRREVMTDYAIGGNPLTMQGSRVSTRGSMASMRGRRAPVTSADGQVILFVNASAFEADEFYTLQAVTHVPSPLPWATVVGQAYRLSASPQAPDLADASLNASLNFSYMAEDVPDGAEPWLRLYYWDGADWQQVPGGSLDTYFNSVSAPVQGEGLYALMASVEIPLYGPGWNLFGYTAQATRPVAEALTSLDGHFTTVYGWEATGPDPYDRWRIYDVTWDPTYNTLDKLAFGQQYWITITQDITLYLKLGDKSLLAGRSLTEPPTTFYGPVLPGSGFTPTLGMEVTAWVDGKLCGRGETMDLNGQVVYRVSVLADGPGVAAGCGQAGQGVSFTVGTQPMAQTGRWHNASVQELALSRAYSVYLPVIVRGR